MLEIGNVGAMPRQEETSEMDLGSEKSPSEPTDRLIHCDFIGKRLPAGSDPCAGKQSLMEKNCRQRKSLANKSSVPS